MFDALPGSVSGRSNGFILRWLLGGGGSAALQKLWLHGGACEEEGMDYQPGWLVVANFFQTIREARMSLLWRLYRSPLGIHARYGYDMS
jgi:hypothetical protein